MNREQYLLTCLAEECAEVAHRAAKAIRFGLTEVQAGQPLDNKTRLQQELGDLLGVCGMLGIVPDTDHLIWKYAAVEQYMALSKERGCLDPEPPPPETSQEARG